MSDTPETDACLEQAYFGTFRYVHEDFARRLERERDEARAAAARWRDALAAYVEVPTDSIMGPVYRGSLALTWEKETG